MTGLVTGAAVFTNVAGHTLTYSSPAISTAGGTVTIDASTGAFSYTPTTAQQLAAGTAATPVSDTFIITASTGYTRSAKRSPCRSRR